MVPTFGIAELAREFGITTRTIRFYEDKGLLVPSRQGQRRIYNPRDRVRLRLIMRGKRLGFSLEEIGRMIDLYDNDPSEIAQLRLFLEKIAIRRAELVARQSDIAEIIDELSAFESRCTALLAEKEAGPSS